MKHARGIRINAVCPGTIDTPMVADMLSGQADAMEEIMKQQSIGRLGKKPKRLPQQCCGCAVPAPVSSSVSACRLTVVSPRIERNCL
jgi:NAD(P)-dependent dehydrogenase (short-subunit alcohol dehydrogenase family)